MDSHRKHFFIIGVLRVAAGLVVCICSDPAAQAGTIVFGSGANAFSMEFVTIGSPGNAADISGSPNPAGAVGYGFQIGKYEVSEDMIAKANALGGLGITMDSRGSAKPATSVSWNEAARFVNWLNTSTGGSAAYNFTTTGSNDNISLWTPADVLDYDAANPFRSKRALYVLPSADEWYKAAYYDPVSDSWNDYPTGSNTAPAQTLSGTGSGDAVYGWTPIQDPADITLAGGLSPFGTMGQGGNVAEWEETAFDLTNSSASEARGVRGGHWKNNSGLLSSSLRLSVSSPATSNIEVGFRVALLSNAAAVPEPGTLAMVTVFTACLSLFGMYRHFAAI